MKKERMFYLDLIRALSMIMIVTYHFAIHFSTEAKPIHFFNSGRWGILGVCLFFMISGASLMYNYSEKIDLKKYYKKRFLAIYPVFWIAYSLVFLYSFWKHKGFFVGEPIYKLLLSFFGMDGYLATYTGTFYLIGDWFLGCIILVYLVFPLLQMIMKKFPKILFTIATLLYLFMIFGTDLKMPINQDFIVSLYSFLMGMYFITYIKTVKTWQMVVAMLFNFLVLGTYPIRIFDFQFLREATFKVNFVGFSAFFVFAYFGSKITMPLFKNVINYISQYSYVIFLVHHYVILEIRAYFAGIPLDKYGLICVYLICWLVILVFSRILYCLNKRMLEFLKSEKERS